METFGLIHMSDLHFSIWHGHMNPITGSGGWVQRNYGKFRAVAQTLQGVDPHGRSAVMPSSHDPAASMALMELLAGNVSDRDPDTGLARTSQTVTLERLLPWV